jgi:vacuolar-type H+-ATPase subunit E/Vma4
VALQDLLTALRTQAAARRDEELSRARAEAERIRADAEAALEHRRRDFVAQIREDEEAVSRRAVARARAESAEGVLSARNRLLQRVRAALADRISGLDEDEEYRRVMTEELGDALERLPEAQLVVRAPASLVPLVRETADGDARVTVDVSDEVGHGFVAAAPSEGIEIDATLEAQLDHAWPRLAVGILAEVAS